MRPSPTFKMVASMEGWPSASECGEKEVGRRARSVSPPSFKAGRHPSTRHPFMFKQCSAPNKVTEAGAEAEAAAYLHYYQQQQYQHQQAAEAAAELHHYQQQEYQKQQLLRAASADNSPFFGSAADQQHQQLLRAASGGNSCAERRGRTLPSLEFYPDEEMSVSEELAPGFEAWRGGSGGQGFGAW
mmetsp:Transcript_57067/g.136142  ORF Transcript_57067/g.136142 Transcript_57067/m.136142 type:complete len:186 (-) Transcript_57067:15-572(-)